MKFFSGNFIGFLSRIANIMFTLDGFDHGLLIDFVDVYDDYLTVQRRTGDVFAVRSKTNSQNLKENQKKMNINKRKKI